MFQQFSRPTRLLHDNNLSNYLNVGRPSNFMCLEFLFYYKKFFYKKTNYKYVPGKYEKHKFMYM